MVSNKKKELYLFNAVDITDKTNKSKYLGKFHINSLIPIRLNKKNGTF